MLIGIASYIKRHHAALSCTVLCARRDGIAVGNVLVPGTASARSK
jgi:hypothetical protein